MGNKVSFFVHDLGNNPIVRAAPFATAFIRMGWEVEIIGFSYTYNKYPVYPPYREMFDFKVVPVYNDIRWVFLKSWKLAKMADGDVIYAFKPKWTTLFPAILASWFGLKKKLIMDAEDNELWDTYIGNGISALTRNPWYVENPVWNRLLHPVTWLIRRKTVVCRSLQKRYGGDIVLHGSLDNARQNISTNEVKSNKRKFRLPPDKKIILFAGKPAKYNGIVEIAEILKRDSLKDYFFVLAGDPENLYFLEAKKILKDRCLLTGLIPHNEIAQLILCADVIPIFQTINKNTEMQMPAKFIEAVAFGIPTIVRDVCDLGVIVSKFHQGEKLIVNDHVSIEQALLLVSSRNFKTNYRHDSADFYNESASSDYIQKVIARLVNGN